MSQNTELNIIIKAIDQATNVFRKIAINLEPIKKSAEGVGKAFGNVTKEVGLLGVKMGALALGAGYLFKTQFINTAAQFERFQSILEAVEGSTIKAKKSMDWVSNFATKTPYELDQVMDAFVKLKAYGLEPTNGLLETIGNTASALNKDMSQGVEAFADALNGQNARLQEFAAINSRIVGDKIIYYYGKNGKLLQKEVDRTNREMIAKTLVAIWNEQYAGAMDKQAKTWNGLMSNIADQWTRFKMMTMNAGVFDYLKNKLSALLAKINEMANSGKLQEVAEIFGKNLVHGLEKLYKIGKDVYPVLTNIGRAIDFSAKVLGGYNNLLWIAIGLMSAKSLFAVIEFGKAVWDLGKALKSSVIWQNLFNIGMVKMAATNIWSAISTGLEIASTAVWDFTAALIANPLTIWVASLTALVGLGVVLYNHWKPFRDLINEIGAKIASLWGGSKKGNKAIPAAKSEGPIPSFDVGSKGITRTGLALVHKGEKITPAGMAAGNYSINYNPTFNISGADAASVAKIKQVVKQSFAECMRDFQHNQGRVAF